MPVAIRPARVSDVDALMAIETTVFATDRISRPGFRRLVRADSAAILIAEDGGVVVGYAALLFRKGSDAARLYSLASAGAGKGVGKALLETSENTASDRGSTLLRLEVREDNARALALYEKSGYRPFGRRQGYYADGATALRLAKVLEAAPQRRSGPGTVAP